MRQEQSVSQDSTLGGRLSSGPPLISATVSWVWESALPPPPSKCVSFRITAENTAYPGCGIHDVQLLSFPPFFLSYWIYLLLKRRTPSEIDGLEQRTAKSKALMCSSWLLWSLSHGGFRRQLQGEGNSLHLKNMHFQPLLNIRRSGQTDFEFPQGNNGWGHGKALWFPSLHKAWFPHLLAEPWQDLGLLPWAEVGEGHKTRAPRLTARPKASFHDALHSSSGKSHSKANRLVSSSHWIYPH